jgi:MarR family transcriptional regulator, repressor for mepA
MSSKAEQLTVAIRTLGFAQRAAADAWVRTSGLTRQQAFTLGYIEEHQDRGVIARELAEMSGTTAASVTSLIQGLEERGLVVRTPSPGDSRVKLLSITPEASALIEGFDDEMYAAQDRMFAPLSDPEKDQLLALLTRITSAIDQTDIPQAPPDRRERRAHRDSP